MTEPLAQCIALAHGAPDFVDTLTDAEVAVLAYDYGVWRRPDQLIPCTPEWRSFGYIAGRGLGKTWSIASYINEAVRAGVYRDIGLAAPSEQRVEKVQWNTLIATAPPWFRPELVGGTMYWPNGAEATYYTPEEPGRPRSSNHDCAWLTELVDWQATTRRELFNNLTTATRRGRAQYLWDTTSKGKHELIIEALEMHAADPDRYRIVRGTMFDNPLLTDEYLLDESRKYTGQEYDEEILGHVYTEAAGALWQQQWIDRNRVDVAPPLELTLVALDTANRTGSANDETGIAVGGRAPDGHVYVLRDHSGKHTPEAWGDIALEEHANGAAGGIVETNRGGDKEVAVLRARATARKVDVKVLRADQLFPQRNPSVFYVRETFSDSSKSTRASGPAALYDLNKAHHVGPPMVKLEREMTTWVPGTKSPNRLDAVASLITELARLTDNRPRHGTAKQAAGAAQARQSLRERLRARASRLRV